MEEQAIQKNKSLLEKLAPYVLIVGVIILGYFLFSKYQTPSIGGSGNIQVGGSPMVQVEVDTNFLVSNAFTALTYIPDSAVFNDATGVIPKGRDNPFAPVK